MWAILARDFRDRRVSTISYCVIGVGLLVLYLSIFPSIKASSQNISQLISSYPQAFLKAFDIDTTMFTQVESYLSAEQFSLMWPILVILLAVSRAGRAVAGEIEKGTAGFLLSLPVSRLRILAGKYLSGLIALIILVAVSTLATIPLARLFSVTTQNANYLALALMGLLFSWAVYALTMLFSTLFSERSPVYFVVGGLLLAMYVLDLVSKLKTNLSDLRYGSLFHYLAASDAVVHNRLHMVNVAVLGGIIVVATVAAAVIFIRRDISV